MFSWNFRALSWHFIHDMSLSKYGSQNKSLNKHHSQPFVAGRFDYVVITVIVPVTHKVILRFVAYFNTYTRIHQHSEQPSIHSSSSISTWGYCWVVQTARIHHACAAYYKISNFVASFTCNAFRQLCNSRSCNNDKHLCIIAYIVLRYGVKFFYRLLPIMMVLEGWMVAIAMLCCRLRRGKVMKP